MDIINKYLVIGIDHKYIRRNKNKNKKLICEFLVLSKFNFNFDNNYCTYLNVRNIF